MKIDKKKFKDSVLTELKNRFGKRIDEAEQREIFDSVSYAAMGLIQDNWMATRDAYSKGDVKQAYYLSAEFLMGRALGNNLVNLTIYSDVKEVLDELGCDINLIEDAEYDAGLGNGGLGRLAACFLDSLATLELPGNGYGIRYRYGIFEQRIVNGYQFEYPDKWLRYGDPWSIKRVDESVVVQFGGSVVVENGKDGRGHYRTEGGELIKAIPFDTPIVGYGVNNVNTLRLWEADAPEEFDLQLFNDGRYLDAVKASEIAQDISRVLYPNDNTEQGKILRLRQQYFFVSASLQDVIRKYAKKHGNDFSKFAKHVAFQLNDTHPVVAIPEMMRIFLDEYRMEWEDAWKIVTATCAFTNHTLMVEALEKWGVETFGRLLPRVFQIVEEINRRFVESLKAKYPGDYARYARMSIIRDGAINMAWLAIVGGHSVNGVAELHTELLRKHEMKDWEEMFPGRINNKTNGVTQRRWLLKSNPELSRLITEKIGDGWITDLDQLKKLAPFADDKAFQSRFMEIKRQNKVRLAKYIKDNNGVEVNLDSIFDVQVKRLHEYKRQLLNVLHIMYLYDRLKTDPKFDMVPRTFIFGAKSASGYRRAKMIIKLINSVAAKVNNDPAVKGKIKVVFLANYSVSLAEKIMPASDLSEQLSTAGKEASGTGNMKFMLNGAPTIGTMDGANIEIFAEAGKENSFVFGLTADRIDEMVRQHSYNPGDLYESDPRIHKVMDQLIDGTFSGTEPRELFRELHDALMYGVEGNPADQYFLLKDFEDYARAQEAVDAAYKDKSGWAKKGILNVANAGKFSSDRTINQYAKEIWEIKPVEVK